MKHQALFSLKDISKKNKVLSAAVVTGALHVPFTAYHRF